MTMNKTEKETLLKVIKSLEDMLSWSNRIGSDEASEIHEDIQELKSII